MKYLGLVVSILAVVLSVFSCYEHNFSAFNGWICAAIWSFHYFYDIKDR